MDFIDEMNLFAKLYTCTELLILKEFGLCIWKRNKKLCL